LQEVDPCRTILLCIHTLACLDEQYALFMFTLLCLIPLQATLSVKSRLHQMQCILQCIVTVDKSQMCCAA